MIGGNKMLNKQLDQRFEMILRTSENFARAFQEMQTDVNDLKADVSYIKNNMTCDTRKQQNILAFAKSHVTKMLGGRDSQAYKSEYRRTIQWLWADFRRLFGINSYKDVPVNDYDRAMDFIRDWRPIKLSNAEEKGA